MIPYFSIVIPTYNSAKTIAACLNSVISQDFYDIEIIIIDGLSDDKTEEIVKSYADDRIKWYAGADDGVYDAMNKGIKLSHGKWLYFIGSDDTFFNQQVLSNVYKYVKNSNAKFVYGDVLINGTNSWAADQKIYDGEFTLQKLLIKNICHQAIFYEKKLFEEFNYYNTLYRVCSDYDFNLKVASKYKLYYTNLIVATFNAGGVSTQLLDDLFFSDYSFNIISYFKHSLFQHHMKPLSASMIYFGKQQFKFGSYITGLQLIIAGYYHIYLKEVFNKVKPSNT